VLQFLLLSTIAYLRCSTVSQSYDSQYHALKEYCTRNGYHDVQFLEETASGSKQRRPVLDNIIENVRKGKVKRVLVYRLDRLSRSLQDLLSTISIFNEFGCAFISTADGVNTEVSSPLGRLQLQLLGVISSFEKDLIRDRVISGLKAARAKGRVGGRPSLPQTTKERMRHMLAEGFKERVIASECGVSVASVYKIKKLALVA